MVTQAAVSLCLTHHKMAWNRGKLKVTSPDPWSTVKRERSDPLKKANQGTLTSHDVPEADARQPARPATVTFFDSPDGHWCPDVGHSDALQGTQVRVNSPGLANPWCALFGSLEYPSGEGLSTIPVRKRPQDVQAHLELLLEADPDTFRMVVRDSASAHTTPKLHAFLEQHQDRLKLVFQPT